MINAPVELRKFWFHKIGSSKEPLCKHYFHMNGWWQKHLLLLLVYTLQQPQFFHLPVTSVIGTSIEDEVSWSNKIESIILELVELISSCLGIEIFEIPLSNIITTDDIVGLSDAELCMHNIATCMHLNASSWEHESATRGSISSTALLSFHKFHA